MGDSEHGQMAKGACMKAYLHVWVFAGRVNCLTFVAANFSLSLRLLSGPTYSDGQGLQYDRHAHVAV